MLTRLLTAQGAGANASAPFAKVIVMKKRRAKRPPKHGKKRRRISNAAYLKAGRSMFKPMKKWHP